MPEAQPSGRKKLAVCRVPPKAAQEPTCFGGDGCAVTRRTPPRPQPFGRCLAGSLLPLGTADRATRNRGRSDRARRRPARVQRRRGRAGRRGDCVGRRPARARRGRLGPAASVRVVPMCEQVRQAIGRQLPRRRPAREPGVRRPRRQATASDRAPEPRCRPTTYAGSTRPPSQPPARTWPTLTCTAPTTYATRSRPGWKMPASPSR
jgi:hypothetical protein